MTSGPSGFSTAVVGADGTWPEPPAVWGYSPLREAEQCPRRWSLSRATYPEVWGRPGYPSRPHLAALLGDVVHRCLELILRAMHDQGCKSLSDEVAVSVMKKLGGYSALATSAIEERLKALDGNPRAVPMMDTLRTGLLAAVPDIRRRVQAVLARTELVSTTEKESSADGNLGRRALPPGTHPEVELRSVELRLAGRADLVTVTPTGCEITDYKTGAHDPDHAQQLETYALLWILDGDLNPGGIPAAKLTLAYATHDADVPPPPLDKLDGLRLETEARIAAVDAAVSERPPVARPQPDLCRFCSVRQLCEDYWLAFPSWPADQLTTPFVDCEGVVVSQNGPKSWILESGSHERTLLRVPTESPGFKVGSHIRVLGVVITEDDDAEAKIATMTSGSEVFALK